MDSKKLYHDSEENKKATYEMVRANPDWAVGRIIAGEKAIDALEDWLTCADTPGEWMRCRNQAKVALGAKKD